MKETDVWNLERIFSDDKPEEEDFEEDALLGTDRDDGVMKMWIESVSDKLTSPVFVYIFIPVIITNLHSMVVVVLVVVVNSNTDVITYTICKKIWRQRVVNVMD